MGGVLPNLNELRVVDRDNGDWQLRDYANKYDFDQPDVRCYFRNIQDAFLGEVEGADAVVGCVAWLTDTVILRRLAELKFASLIVQKEDFLRPDARGKAELHQCYKALPQPYDRFELPHPVGDLSTNGDTTWEAVRCVGNHNSNRSPAHPRMHHKFVVFCRLGDGYVLDANGDRRAPLMPYKVWTGSFNLTYVGGFSLENAVVIQREEIVRSYFLEWGQVACLSESLDWSSEWSAPDFRVGT